MLLYEWISLEFESNLLVRLNVDVVVYLRFKEVHSISSNSSNEGLNNLNTHAGNSYVEIWYLSLVWLVRSLLTSHKSLFSASLCKDFSDLTNPISNHIHLAISVVYGTFTNSFFTHAC